MILQGASRGGGSFAIKLTFALFALWQSFVPVQAHADGKGFSTLAEDSVQTADQRAVVVWKEGREKLVIDTGLESESGSVAWVIPVPSVPEVRQATRGMFPTLELFFAPRLKEWSEDWFLFALVFALVVLFALRIARVILAGEFIALFILSVLFTGMLAPALGSAGAGISVSGVELLSQETVGSYEVVTIEGASADAILNWLKGNGFKAGDAARPVLSDYVLNGWVFVAAKLRRDEGKDRLLKPHPLELEFKTERCIYPMRLTGVDQEKPVSVELFVFAGQEATVSGFHRRSTLQAKRPALDSDPAFRSWPQTSESIRIGHPYLTELVGLEPLEEYVATRLRGTLSPEEMDEDLVVEFKPPWFSREQRYTRGAMIERSLIAGLVLFGIGMLAGSVVSRRWKDPGLLLRLLPHLFLIAFIGLGGTYTYLSITEKQGTEAFEGENPVYNVRPGLQIILNEAEESAGSERLDSDWVWQAVETGWPRLSEDPSLATPIPQQLDAPGHYTVETSEDGVKVFIYDYFGTRHLVWQQGAGD